MNTPVKQCSKCHKNLPATLEYFHAHKSRKDGLRVVCKSCRSTRKGIDPSTLPKDGYKFCSKCKKELPATREFFSLNNRSPSGLSSHCKKCHSLYNTQTYRKGYRERRRDNINTLKRQYYWRNREQLVRQGRERRANNKELYSRNKKRRHRERMRTDPAYVKKHNERSRRWRANNKEKTAAYARKNSKRAVNRAARWAKANPKRAKEHSRASKAKRRAAKLKSKGTHTRSDIKKQYSYQGGKCYYCHELVNDSYHVDHVIPLTRGGSNGPENIVIACPTCNRRKNNKMPHEWAEGGRLL